MEEKSKKIKNQKSQGRDTKHQELETQLKRALADYQNLERRIEEERRMLSTLSSIILIEKFLPVLDNLESAASHVQDEGLKLVVKQFKDVLESEGLEEIAAEGQDFDPNLHEAIETQESDVDNKVMKVLTKGFKIGDKVIRPAKVIVSKLSGEIKSEVQNQQEGEINV